MKFFVYNFRDFDEKQYFDRYSKEFGLEYAYTTESPTMDNLHLAEGCAFVSVITTPITAGMLDRMKEMGIGMICTRTIGYNHIDIAHAEEIGMIVSHITYDPEGVADYTVMMIIAALRRLEASRRKYARNDFSLEGIMGRTLKECTVGIVGAGGIGTAVMRDLSGFGCSILYYDRRRKDEADRYGRHVSMEELLAQSDIVSLHLELNKDTDHMFDRSMFDRMKTGAILVNTARGPLVDTKALVDAVESGKLSGAALDVIEGEFDMCYYDRSSEDYSNPVLESVRSHPQILHTQHLGFYYETAIRDMVRNCLLGMKKCRDGEEIPYRLA